VKPNPGFHETTEKLPFPMNAVEDNERMGESARLAVPTNEHFLPLLYALVLRNPGEPAVFFTEKVTMCSLSMRPFMLG
jgi:4,5-DOPA dioxygenase extradiol